MNAIKAHVGLLRKLAINWLMNFQLKINWLINFQLKLLIDGKIIDFLFANQLFTIPGSNIRQC